MVERRTIPRKPDLPHAMDWAALRAEGMDYLRKFSGAIWTDHNTHDPGITTLELLCHALTDLAYRTDHSTADLLARRDGMVDPRTQSGLMPAHEVLTTAPRTAPDYRRLLLRISGVRNAWLSPSPPGETDVPVYADCATGKLSVQALNQKGGANHPVLVSGLWQVRVDLEPDDLLGDMNTRALDTRVRRGALKGAVLRLDILDAAMDRAETLTHGAVKSVMVNEINPQPEGFAAKLTVTFADNAELSLAPCKIVVVEDRPRFDQPALVIDAAKLTAVLTDVEPDSPLPLFWTKQRARAAALARIAAALHANRGLAEDFRSIEHIDAHQVGICADIELAPGADLEAIQAAVYHAIESYLAPPVKFRALGELLADGVPVETIFEGPHLDGRLTFQGQPLFTRPGFITEAELAATDLRDYVQASDLINLIHDIPGVEAVRNLQLQGYDLLGLPVAPPERWTLRIREGCRPAFHEAGSKLLFIRAGIPYRAQPTELAASLAELRALDRREVYVPPDQALTLPRGLWRGLDQHYPVQHDFPQTYKIGAAGVAPSEPAERIAQSRQFKAYLTFFEQILADYLGQLTGLRRLYSLDDTLTTTWASLRLTTIAPSLGPNWDKEFLLNPADYADDLKRARLTETEAQFVERRNRVLDHLVARFAERFADYALMQYRLSGDRLRTRTDLITDKIAFLRTYPKISRERGQGANIRPENASDIWDSDNASGLEARAGRLVGIDDLRRRNLACAGHFGALMAASPDQTQFRITITGPTAVPLFASAETFATDDAALTAARTAYTTLRDEGSIVIAERPASNDFALTISTGEGTPLTHSAGFPTEIEATRSARAILDRYDELLGLDLCQSEGMHLVEHILLRPRTANAALIEVCLPEDCDFCGDEDPYSFRVSVVLPYWPKRFRNLDYRSLVERTLREEAPAHVQVKICWIGQGQMAEFDGAHRAWLEALRSGRPENIAAPAARLIGLLGRLSTVYPVATLHDCDVGDDKNPVRLGSSALGIF